VLLGLGPFLTVAGVILMIANPRGTADTVGSCLFAAGSLMTAASTVRWGAPGTTQQRLARRIAVSRFDREMIAVHQEIDRHSPCREQSQELLRATDDD
jgi:hypothetical protein